MPATSIELKPLVPTDDEILEAHSTTSWTPEYLYSQEYDAVFQKLFNQYLHGEFSHADDASDFESFHRMFQELTGKRNELEDRFFPDGIQKRAEEREKITVEEETQRCRECYDKVMEGRNGGKKKKKGGFSWKKLFLACFGRVEKVEEVKGFKADLFKY